MPSAKNNKGKTITLNLTHEEFEKVSSLAEIRNLNPTAYTRLVALGNRIKPTVIEKSPATSNEDEIQELKNRISELEKENEIFKRLTEHINSDNGYINFNTYKNDEQLRMDIAKYAK